MSVPTDSAAFSENRRLLGKLLAYYSATSIEELNAQDDPEFWSRMLWSMWKWNYKLWGTYAQCFDMTDPACPVVQEWDGERRFFSDGKTGEVMHEKTYRKAGRDEPEHIIYSLPRTENLTREGLACFPEGAMAANVRVAAYATTGHGTAVLKQVYWGTPLFGETSFQPDDKIRLQVSVVFSTPSIPGEKGQLKQVMLFRDDVTARPWFSQSQYWQGHFDAAFGSSPSIKKIDIQQASSVIFHGSSKRARGFKITPDMANYARVTLSDGEIFDIEALAEGGSDAQFYALHDQEGSSALLNIVQSPEMGKALAAKWRIIWKLGDRLMVGVCAYDGETYKQQPAVYEFACE
ncbi:hypothetical protein BKA93DRAFT_725868 [Sparassis latifolia]